MIDFPVKEIIEGKTRLIVPDTSSLAHPAHAPVFFNPSMALNRDVTVSVMSVVKPRNMLDALAGTGAKGIRVMNEAGIPVVFNDKSALAVEFIKKNLALNGLEARVENKDANILMREECFHAIDIDPFGSPGPFIDSAAQSIKDKGILAITATDTAALTGTYPSSGLRKYGVVVGRTSFMHELGIRALTAFLVREFARYNIGVRPMFTHSTLHYYRVFLEARRSRRRATEAVKALRWLIYDRKTEDRWYSRFQDSRYENFGPVWPGELWEREILESFEGVSEEARRLGELARSEREFVLPYIDYHKLAGKYGLPLLKMSKLEEVLSSKGITFSRTHFCSHCFKSDAQPSDIVSVLKSYK